MNYQPLHYIFVPATHQSEAYTLLLLHGTGGDENDFIEWGKGLLPNANLLGVRGNVLENGTTTRFFRRLATGILDEADLQFRTHELVRFITELSQKEGFNSSKVIALGYSNGANMAGGLLMLYPKFLAGAVLWRAMLPLKNIVPEPSNNANVLMISGSSDPYYDENGMNRYEQLLTQSGFIVTHHLLNAGHNLVQKDLQLTATWLKQYDEAATL